MNTESSPGKRLEGSSFAFAASSCALLVARRALAQPVPHGKGTCGSRTDWQTRACAGQRARRAFSLIELAVVILVLGILSAVSVPRFADALRYHRISAAADRIVADLVRAQSAAYGSSTSKTVTFNVAASTYEVAGVSSLDRSSGSYVVDLKVSPYLSSLVTVWDQTGIQSITFNGYGLPDKGGTIVVGCSGAQKVISISASTGAAAVQ